MILLFFRQFTCCTNIFFPFSFSELGVLVITLLQGKEMVAMDSNGESVVKCLSDL